MGACDDQDLGHTFLILTKRADRQCAYMKSAHALPLLRYDAPADGSGGEYQLTASGVIQYYYNPFAINGGLRIPIRLHPKVPPGTILGWCENLPIQYQSNEVPNVAEVKTRQDY